MCGPRYSAARAQEQPGPELDLLIGALPRKAAVLDIGCGSGLPVTVRLAEVAQVIGVDISPAQIEQARRNVPQAKFITSDIMATEFEPQSFDAVIAVYALFHLPREEHRLLLERIATWLRPSGSLFASFVDTSHLGYTEPDFFGVTMYWSHFDACWYRQLLPELGFEFLTESVLGHGYHAAPDLPAERHPLLFARLQVK